MAFGWNDVGQILSGAGDAIGQFRQARTLADLGKALETGDYKTAARAAIAGGDVRTGLSLLQLGQQREADANAFGMLGEQPQAAAQPAATSANIADGSQPRGLRNMNPGNIEAGPFAQSQPGYVGSDGRFARFDNLEHGIGAQSALLQRYGDKGINTVAGVVNRWAPQAENGAATGNYAAFVARKIGVGPNDPIDLSNPEIRQRLAYAMGEFENGRPIVGSAPVQVADASGAIPASAAPTAPQGDPLETRIQNITRALSNPNISPNARQILSVQLQEAERRRSEMRQDAAREEARAFQRANLREARADRQQERDLRRQERADQVEKQTGEQANAATFATRMAEAEKVISDPAVYNAALGNRGRMNEVAGKVPLFGTALQDEQFQKYDQARRDFVNAILRKESGAAITQGEFDNAEKQYFPVPGNPQSVIDQKAKNRATAMEAIARGGTPSFRKEFFGKRAASQGVPSVGAIEDGYRFKGGNPADPNSWERAR